MRERLVCRANTRLNSLVGFISLSDQGERRHHSPDPCYPEWFCWFGCLSFSGSRRMFSSFRLLWHSGGILKGLFLNACHERLSLAFFVRLSMVRFVFHCRFSRR